MRIIEAYRATLRGIARYRVIIPPSKENPIRRQRWFRTKERADAFASQVNEDRGGRIEELYALSRQEQTLLAQALRKAGGALGVLNAVEAHVESIPRLAKSLKDAIAAFEADKKNASRSDLYLAQIKWALHSFKFGRADLACSAVTPDMIRAWLSARGAAASRQSGLQRLRTFFEFCRREGWVKVNPAKAVTRPANENKPPTFLTVGECKTLLVKCLEVDRPLILYFALCLFGGLRPSEARRVKAENLLPDFVEVFPKKTRNRSRRLVTRSEPLNAWLALGGEFDPKNWRTRFRLVVRASGVKWSNDCLRHTFVSYHYAIHGASATAREAGHSEQVLFQHYRALVTRQQAEEFWRLRP